MEGDGVEGEGARRGKKEMDLAEALLMLVSDTKEHLKELIASNGGNGGATIDRICRSVMGEFRPLASRASENEPRGSLGERSDLAFTSLLKLTLW